MESSELKHEVVSDMIELICSMLEKSVNKLVEISAVIRNGKSLELAELALRQNSPDVFQFLSTAL